MTPDKALRQSLRNRRRNAGPASARRAPAEQERACDRNRIPVRICRLADRNRPDIKKAPGIPARCSKGAVTYSPGFPVPSALRSLTSLFGMGRGGTSALWPPCLFPFFRRRYITRRDVMRKDHRWKQTRSYAAAYRIMRCVVFFASPPIGGESQKAFGQLVLLGFTIADFTPAAYRRRSLRRPCMEILS